MSEEDAAAAATLVKNERAATAILSDNNDERSRDAAESTTIKVYAKRWLVLAMYAFYTALVASQYVQYSVISNIVTRYYDVSPVAVNFTSTIFSLSYLLLVFPLSYASERIGLQNTLILGSGVCCVGAWIKIFSATRDGFVCTMVGQCLIAASVVVLQTMPGRLAANWFGASEQSKATSMGIFGPQLGSALSFFLPPILVKNHENVEDIGADLSFMFWCGAIAFTVNFVLLLVFFQREPKLPPSEKRALQRSNLLENKANYRQSMKRIITNKRFLVFCHCFGLNVCILGVLDTMLNQMILVHFENAELDAGRIGVVNLTTGMLGSVVFGFVIDRTKNYRAMALAVYFATFCIQVMFSAAMFAQIKWLLYVYALLVGFLTSGFIALAYKLSAEYTYPESEASSAGVLIVHSQIYSFSTVMISGQIFKYFGDKPVHALLCAALLLGFGIACCVGRGGGEEKRRLDDVEKVEMEYRDVPTRRMDKDDSAGGEKSIVVS